jgi:hypothetical protein
MPAKIDHKGVRRSRPCPHPHDARLALRLGHAKVSMTQDNYFGRSG